MSEFKDTEIGKLPADWNLYRIGEIADVTKLAGFEYTDHFKYVDDGEIIALRALNVRQGVLDLTDVKKIKKEVSDGLIRSKLFKDDILFTYVGANIGQFALIPENDKFHLAPNICRIRVSDRGSPYFLYSYFRTKLFQDNLANFSVGSSQPTMPMGNIRQIKVPFPSLKEQFAIASMISSLDDKIELLNRQNKTLEQLAETLFRQWFVEEAEEDWTIDTLGNVFDIGIGRTPPRKEHQWFSINPNDIKWVSIKDMGTSGIYIDTVSEYLTQEAVERFNIPIIPENTVMLSFKMTIGRLAISTEEMLSNEAIAHFKQKEKSNLFPEFLCLFLKTYRWEQMGSTSSIVEAINSQMIKDMELVIPDDNKLEKFKNLIIPYFKKIKINQNQIRTLTQLRDTLLPKLMSGEVRVKI